MEIDFNTIPYIVSLAVVFFAIYIIVYYKFFYSIIDPLFIWIFTTAFASVLVLEVIPDLEGLLHFFGCQLSLWFGFFVCYSKSKEINSKLISANERFVFTDQPLLRYTTYFLLIIYITSNIIIGYAKGYAFLSDNPTGDKITNFQQGFGLFRKINWSTGTFVTTSLVYMYLIKRKGVDLVFLFVVTFFYSLDGSKAATLQVFISAGVIFYHPAMLDKKNILKKIKRYFPLAFLLIVGTFFSVLLKENDGIDRAFFAFIKRLLYSADSILYYYQPVNITYFEKYSSWDYISVLTNPVLGFFRLQDYKEAPGVIMLDNILPPGSVATELAAPNAPFYVEARIYFNYWIGFPFSFLVGYVYALVRTHYFSLKQSSAFYFIFMGSLLHLASALIGDVNLAITQSFDLVFFVVPPYIIISFLLTNKLKLKWRKGVFNAYKHT